MPRLSPPRVPRLPQLLDRKIYKTGQTRGADDDEIYQNRVSRTGTVLIPYSAWERCRPGQGVSYENGFIVLISPADYFSGANPDAILAARGLTLGINALVFYETRELWNAHNPDALAWTPASSRTTPLGGRYLARIPATTAATNGVKINRGFTGTAMKGAGIRVYEYAATATNDACRLQLEMLFWTCHDSEATAVRNGMSAAEAAVRKEDNLAKCRAGNLLDISRLTAARMLDATGTAICPLCLERRNSSVNTVLAVT